MASHEYYDADSSPPSCLLTLTALGQGVLAQDAPLDERGRREALRLIDVWLESQQVFQRTPSLSRRSFKADNSPGLKGMEHWIRDTTFQRRRRRSTRFVLSLSCSHRSRSCSSGSEAVSDWMTR